MPYTVTRFEDTPNPNAVKCIVSPSPGEAPRSYFNAEQARAANDELAMRLFEIPGVRNVLIHTAFITVGRSPETPWNQLKPRVRRTLAGAG